MNYLKITLLILLTYTFVTSTDAELLWQNIEESRISDKGIHYITSEKFKTYSLSENDLKQVLCPNFEEVLDNTAVCTGDLADQITNWQNAVETNNEFAILNPNTDATVTYSALPTNSNLIGCDNLVETMIATINCFGPDAIDDGGANDDVLLRLGTYTLTTFPSAQAPGASPANWDGTTYTAQEGDAAGTIDIEVTTGNGCTGTFTIATPGCDSCQDAIDGGFDICAILAANPTSPLATLDCDGGGIDNETECANGTNPLDNPADDCDLGVVCPLGATDILCTSAGEVSAVAM